MAEPDGPERRCDPAGLVAAYEVMRAAALSGQPEGWRHGQGVLAGRGLAAWTATCAAVVSAPAAGTPAPEHCDPPTPTQSRPPDHDAPVPPLSSLPDAGQIVAVIAQMALAHL